MSRVLTLCLALLPAPLAAQSPIADVICAPTERMMARLSGQYGSERRAMGLRNPEEVVEIWTDARGDWAMVITYASGNACIVAMGENWTTLGPENPA